MKPQAYKAATLFECLYDTKRRKEYLRTKYEAKIYKSGIGRVLTYAAEARQETSITRQMAVTKQMNTLWKFIGKTSLDHLRKLVIMEQYEIQPIRDWINKRREECNNKHSRKTK
jgi:hypothetical protein